MKSDIINSLTNIKQQPEKEIIPETAEKQIKLQLSQLHLYHRTFNNIRTHPKHDPVKESILRHSVTARLKNGSTVAQLAKEPFFEDVLDICERSEYFPAHRKGKEIPLDNWKALRNCKYLRVSEKNLSSLKEATIRSLVDK